MEDFLNSMLLVVSSVAFTSIVIAILYNWIAGHFDSRKMIQSLTILLTIGAGITVSAMFTANINSDSINKNQDFCTNTFPFLCGSWPVFFNLFPFVLQPIIKTFGLTGAIPSILISSLAAFMIYTKLIKGVWLGNKEIMGAFFCGIILYLTLAHFYYLKDGIWNLVDQLFNTDGKGSLAVFAEKYNNWNVLVSRASYENDDASIYSKISTGVGAHFLEAFKNGLLELPLGFLGALNCFIIVLQQLFICMIPFTVLKSVFTFENNTFVALKAIFGYSIFCVGLHIELMLLSFIPSAPESISFTSFFSGTFFLLVIFLLIMFVCVVMTVFVVLVLFSILKPFLSVAAI
ncbi:hypothetical protein [Fluviispira sanaruensis]|uniref:Uncharacterized protein n=1 Tax=Fluviispira sanaruensis TaxID=2493639 RepID=A0A4P2VQF5_FLUSA|nr:hypothetical protein [Fluviispira sanaruensis]BBH54630.1 hypothetical protein JCM31447_31040 [Fluviispira sanaruensis]